MESSSFWGMSGLRVVGERIEPCQFWGKTVQLAESTRTPCPQSKCWRGQAGLPPIEADMQLGEEMGIGMDPSVMQVSPQGCQELD